MGTQHYTSKNDGGGQTHHAAQAHVTNGPPPLAAQASVCGGGGQAKRGVTTDLFARAWGGRPFRGGAMGARGRDKTHRLGQWPTRAGVRARTGTLEERKALEAWRKCVLEEVRINEINNFAEKQGGCFVRP